MLPSNFKNGTKYSYYAFFKTFDYNQDGFFDFEDFVAIILPQTDKILRENVNHTIEMEKMTVDNSPQSSDVRDLVPVLNQVAIWLHLVLKYHGSVEQAKIELEKCRDFSTLNLFKCIDVHNLNYIGIPQLLKFFLKFKIQLPKKYTDALYRRTNVQLNMMLTFQEFCKMVQPIMQHQKIQFDINESIEEKLEEA